MLEQVIGKKSKPLEKTGLLALTEKYPQVHMDVGTGDGLFVWRLARNNPQTLAIGLDASRESLAEGSARAAKKPARGGAQNALFLCANALEMPEELTGLAHSISVNYPWGSLLLALAGPDETFLKKLAALARPQGAALSLYLNMQVFEDEVRKQNLQLPELTEESLTGHLLPAYAKAGLLVEKWRFIEPGAPVEVASTWAGRLTRRSRRPTLELLGRVAP